VLLQTHAHLGQVRPVLTTIASSITPSHAAHSWQLIPFPGNAAHLKGLVQGGKVPDIVLCFVGCIRQPQLQPLPALVGLHETRTFATRTSATQTHSTCIESTDVSGRCYAAFVAVLVPAKSCEAANILLLHTCECVMLVTPSTSLHS
jgi:hypothetical protein